MQIIFDIVSVFDHLALSLLFILGLEHAIPPRYMTRSLNASELINRLAGVERKFPGDRDRLARMSLIQGKSIIYIEQISRFTDFWPSLEGTPQYVRMANLACVASRKVNGVAEVGIHFMLIFYLCLRDMQLHSELVRTTICKDFVDYFGVSKFQNVTNGITPRRWLDQCNPLLSDLITETLKIKKEVWLKDLYKLEGLLKFADDPTFQKKWAVVKQSNKERLAHHVETEFGIKVNTQSMFDVQIKRLHEYKVHEYMYNHL